MAQATLASLENTLFTGSLRAVCACPESTWGDQRIDFQRIVSAGTPRTLGVVSGDFCMQYIAAVGRFHSQLWGVGYDVLSTLMFINSSNFPGSDCLPALVLTAHACVVAAHSRIFPIEYEPFIQKMTILFIQLIILSGHCLEPGNLWSFTAGQVLHRAGQFRKLLGLRAHRGAAMGILRRSWNITSLPLCVAPSSLEPPAFGFCGADLGHYVLRNALDFMDVAAASSSGVVLCSHVPLEFLASLERQLRVWASTASIAVLLPSCSATHWAEVDATRSRWAADFGLSQVRFSFVCGAGRTAYDRLYPAGVLRRVAVEASPSDLVLLVDPGFLTSAGLAAELEEVDRATSRPLFGDAIAEVLRTPIAVALVSFVVHDEGRDLLDMGMLRKHINRGSGGSYDRALCPFTRPYAWQRLLLEGDVGPEGPWRFRHLGSHDLNHLGLLTLRSRLRFENLQHLHGLANVDDARHRNGLCNGFPRGLRAIADQLLTGGVGLVQAPRHFLWKPSESTDFVSKADATFLNYYPFGRESLDLMYVRFVNMLPLEKYGHYGSMREDTYSPSRGLLPRSLARGGKDFFVFLSDCDLR